MGRQQKTLALLHEELSTIALFDRVHDYATGSDPADNQAYASRQVRRLEIMAEIRRLSANPEHRDYSRIRSAVLPLCVMFFYLLK
jgi:hypothetical protein